jgi:CheY-like chemotaxis protein
MSADDLQPKPNTRLLNQPQHQETPMPVRTTSPLDVVPWVLEFRVVGTASTIQVQVSESMTIGRSDADGISQPEIDLTPHGAYTHGVSRRHAQILSKSDRITIKDLNSTNGTRLNGYVLSPDHEYRLRHGDELTIGQLRLQVLFAVVPTSGDNTPMPGMMKTSKPEGENIPHVGSGQHVLVIEDDSDVAAVFRLALEHAGFEVAVYNNGGAALTAVSSKLPDAIVLDLMLTDVSGPDLIRYVRKQEGGADVPMLVVSGATGGFQMNQALEAGANLFLGKPVNVHELVQTLGDLLNKQQAVNGTAVLPPIEAPKADPA